MRVVFPDKNSTGCDLQQATDQLVKVKNEQKS
jgi:hypothetical protein